MALFRAFASHHFRCKMLLEGRDQFTEGHALVGLFLGARAGSSATLLGDLLSQHTVEAPNRRVACNNRFTQLCLLFLDLQSQFSPLRLQSSKTPDIGTIGSADQMGEHMHIGKGSFDQLGRRGPVRQEGPIGPWNITAVQCLLPQEANSFAVLGLMEALDRSLVAPVERFMQEPPGDIVVSSSFDGFFMNSKIRESLKLMPLELGDNLVQLCRAQTGTKNRAIQMGSKLPEFATLPGRYLA